MKTNIYYIKHSLFAKEKEGKNTLKQNQKYIDILIWCKNKDYVILQERDMIRYDIMDIGWGMYVNQRKKQCNEYDEHQHENYNIW